MGDNINETLFPIKSTRQKKFLIAHNINDLFSNGNIKRLLLFPKITLNSISPLRKNCSVGTIKSERD